MSEWVGDQKRSGRGQAWCGLGTDQQTGMSPPGRAWRLSQRVTGTLYEQDLRFGETVSPKDSTIFFFFSLKDPLVLYSNFIPICFSFFTSPLPFGALPWPYLCQPGQMKPGHSREGKV